LLAVVVLLALEARLRVVLAAGEVMLQILELLLVALVYLELVVVVVLVLVQVVLVVQAY
jgi:hypothetical protein